MRLASRLAHQVARTALDTYHDTVQEVRLAKENIKQANEFTEQTITVKLTNVINSLIEQSSSEVVAVALMKALTGTILKTRPASRDEIKNGENVFVIRMASSHEINQRP